jgi:methylated-DNA-[protein]-cysteine S-methyltransferase
MDDDTRSGEAPNMNSPLSGGAVALDLETAAESPGADPCDVACDAMPGLVLGDLTQRDKEWVVDHTQTCNYCAKMLGGYQHLDNVLDRMCDDLDELSPPTPQIPATRRAGYGQVQSPVGPLMIASSEQGLCEIAFGENETEQEFLQHLRRRGFRPVPDQDAISTVADELGEYFRGERNHFEVPFDFSGISPFTKAVLEATTQIPFGRLTSYRGIAERIGQPSATRAVGNALGRNPIPVVIPCHRIVRSDSSIGGYTGGLKIKQHLLALEGVMLPTA